MGADVHIHMLIYMFACMHICMYKYGDFEKHSSLVPDQTRPDPDV